MVKVSTSSITSVGGKRIRRKYTRTDIDWLVAYDASDNQCYFIPGEILGDEGQERIWLRKVPPKNKQVKGINWAKDFMEW